jgi:hypothetical protein
MNVKQLRELLSQLDETDLVVLSCDEEGNSYSPVSELYVCTYADRMVYPRVLTEELKKRGYSKDDLYHGKDGKKAIALYPRD